MPAFAYTSGDISHLTGGGPANMADLQGPFTDLRTAINGNLDETNVPNLTAAFTHYKEIERGGALAVSLTAATFILFSGAALSGTNGAVAIGSANSAVMGFVFDPSDWLTNSRTTKLRLRVQCVTNAVAPGVTFTVGLYPISAYGGASGAAPTITTLGTVVSGSTVAFASPGATTNTVSNSGDFNAPAFGAYAMGVACSGTQAVNSQVLLSVQMQMRQV